MNKKQFIVVSTIISVFLLYSLASAGNNIDNAILEADSYFTYNKQPIHPGLVAEFNPWVSDTWKPMTVSVDVSAAYGTNEYFEDDAKVKENGYVYLQKKEEEEYFYYKWLGKLNNGLHILEVGEGGGGSGIFKALFIVKFEKGFGFTPEGQKYGRLLMSIVRNENLGDGDNGKITVLPDRVILGKSQYRDKPVVLEFASVLPLFTQDKHSIDKLEEECINKDSTTAGMANCTYEAQKQWDAEMNRYYKLLMAALDKNGQDKLRESQRAWIKFRDAEFESIENMYPRDATVFINIRAADKMSIVKERALQLKSYYEVLKELI